jgi:hypothetical protein
MFNLFHARRHYPKFYEPYYDQLNFYDGRDAWLASQVGVPREAVLLYSVHWCELEIQNGGIWQFFFNSTGVVYPEAKDGFSEIGMPNVAEILTSAASRLGEPFPFSQDKRRKIVGPPEKQLAFDDLDKAFWDLASADTFFRAKPKFVPFAEAYAEAWQLRISLTPQ